MTAATKPAVPIFHITDTDLNGDTREFLVRAETAAQAKNHVRRLVSAERASQDVLVRMLGAGAKIEDAGGD